MGIRRDRTYRPKVGIIVPTHNKVKFTESKLNDIIKQERLHLFITRALKLYFLRSIST